MSKLKEGKKSYVNFFAPVTLRIVQELFKIIQKKLRDGTEIITILISSGGEVNASISAYNFLCMQPMEKRYLSNEK